MQAPQLPRRRAHSRAALMPALVFGAVVLGSGAAWFWLDDTSPPASDVAKPRAVNQAAGAADQMNGSVSSSVPTAAPSRAGSVSATSGDAMRTASPQPDPFRNFLDTHGSDAAPGQAAQEIHLVPNDPFKAAFEEAAKRTAAARASPFGAPR